MEIQQKNIVIATTAAVVVITTALGILTLRRRKNRAEISTVDGHSTSSSKENLQQFKTINVEEMQPPKEWIEIGKVSALHIYPMKSGRVVNLTKADATEIGLREICRKGRLPLRDRVFVVYKENDGSFISSKIHKKILKLTVNSLTNDSVELSFENDRIIVKVPESNGQKNINMRNETIPTIDCGDEVGAWVSNLIYGKDRGLRVGYWPESTKRDITTVFYEYMKVYTDTCNDFVGAYSDISSYLIINQSSIDDLNLRISDDQNRVTAGNFRPNIVVQDAKPYSEDNWKWVKIGEEAIFKTFQPCARCSVTTINPETLEKSRSHEPIKTLKKYRQVTTTEQKKLHGDNPIMGMYMGVHTKGRIKYGDPVFISTI